MWSDESKTECFDMDDLKKTIRTVKQGGGLFCVAVFLLRVQDDFTALKGQEMGPNMVKY